MNNLVEIKGKELVTTSLMIAKGVDKDHSTVIKLVRTYHEDLKEFGLVRFEIQPRLKSKHGGGDIEYAFLNEQQSTLLITYMRNNDKVRSFKKLLVKEFFKMREEIYKNKNSKNIDWKKERRIAATDFRAMNEVLQLKREEIGKKSTEKHHFMTEAKLINWCLKGKFEGINRDQLSKQDLSIISKLEVRNMALISLGHDYKKRKEMLKVFYNDLMIKKIK